MLLGRGACGRLIPSPLIRSTSSSQHPFSPSTACSCVPRCAFGAGGKPQGAPRFLKAQGAVSARHGTEPGCHAFGQKNPTGVSRPQATAAPEDSAQTHAFGPLITKLFSPLLPSQHPGFTPKTTFPAKSRKQRGPGAVSPAAVQTGKQLPVLGAQVSN